METYPVTLHHIFTSPAHNYFTRPRFEIGDAPSLEHTSVTLDTGSGILGDRFYDAKYPVTFFSLEVAEAVAEGLEKPLQNALFRRNVIISGINLNALIGERFTIGEVMFEGMAHCPPCSWMDAALGKGAYGLMKGRGGLRAKVLRGGRLECGSTSLVCEKAIVEAPEIPLKMNRLP